MLRSQNKFSVYSFAKVNTVRRLIAVSLYLLMCNTHAFAAYWQHELKPDEYVQLQNSTAKTDVSGMAQVRVHAWVYERERRPGARCGCRIRAFRLFRILMTPFALPTC